MSGLEIGSAVVIVALSLACLPRWWMVAQKEHYGPGRVTAIHRLWAASRPVQWVAGAAAVVLGLAGLFLPPLGAVSALLWLSLPLGLPLWQRGAVVFTPRLRRLAAVNVALVVAVAAVLWLLSTDSLMVVGLLPLVIAPLTDVALAIAKPIEDRLARRWQVQAANTIRRVNPRIVAITGSYGKTSTKNFANHLIQGRWSTLASPASFNNAMGLSRAVNDRLEPGTDVFIAEMGTYGPGEITALTTVFPPEISAITTIGEAHLERMKDKATIARAKSEILPPARTVVLSIDDPELRDLVTAYTTGEYAGTKRVITVSAQDPSADISLLEGSLTIEGETHPVAGDWSHPINVAVAVGLARALDVPTQTIVARLPGIPGTPHRAEANRTAEGVWVIDDTFNSNPTGAAAALRKAVGLAGETGTVWTITPGMVELGHEQASRNEDFARAATASERMRLAVVGWTNRRALTKGEPDRTLTFGSRTEAQRHVLAQVRPADVVLYENDLPSHYP
ncbi:hypothetical protein BH09ACT11_BH09ACT11_18180 [soil metagenome]